eukprot:CAMPEP_0118699648 /NCGR_PEP_ID=MMETSP0800-20121206/16042_1 /TAXON_ID=210618 ORGANISM="Striatella unipunctata, Strain CCMP2910" /NCGR_SAMPLE_ID=MMETSP0800 /ASSEMBLY_ACC=CAM_ASM_000638 /LENGTH=262 /DNA_ID=CAMNT_0006599941 /DNA_START=131 /DNA_END=919 /DNA_ORIENTATION=-
MKLTFCPFSFAIFIASAAAFVHYSKNPRTTATTRTFMSSSAAAATATPAAATTAGKKPTLHVVFILGGPGAGKGTQCNLLAERKGWKHLSAGDLLRAERKNPSSDVGQLIEQRISQGQLVPDEITVGLLFSAMSQAYYNSESESQYFLIDGFPRSLENNNVWNELKTKQPFDIQVSFCLYLNCPEDVMTSRLLERGKSSGRTDDNLEVIRKRFDTYQTATKPILDAFQKDGMLKTVQADKNVDEVYEEVSKLFVSAFPEKAV